MQLVKLTNEQADGITQNGNCVNGEWYFIPYWFKHVRGEVFELHTLGDLPKELTDDLNFDRRYIAKEREYPMTEEECK